MRPPVISLAAAALLAVGALAAAPKLAAQQNPSAPVSPEPPVAATAGPLLPPAPEAPVVIPDLAPISGFTPGVASDGTQPGEAPRRSAPSGLQPHFFGLLGPFHRPVVPPLFPGNGARLQSLVHDGKLYLSIRDAIALAIENNLDVEVERYNLLLADTDRTRAQGGGTTRGIDYSVAEPPNGVGGPGSPLLNTSAVNPNPTTPTVTDLTSLNATGQASSNLSGNSTGFTYSAGPTVPLYDPSFIATSGYLRRSDTVSLVPTTTTTGAITGTSTTGATSTVPQPLTFITANASYLEGFRTGAELSATVNNASQTEYGEVSQHNPFSRPSTSVTFTQPLLRGFGSVNLRYLRIANLDRKVSRLLFEQQVLETVYGISRLYFDLVSLGENVAVQQESLRAAQKLRGDTAAQVEQGTLASIDLARATALVSSSQFTLIQAQGLYRTQEVILRNQLLRADSPVFAAQFSEIVPTDKIVVPATLDNVSVSDLIQQGLAHRPDLAQSELQIKSGQISVAASRNQALPQLNLYANAETRGAAEAAYEPLGSAGTGLPSTPQNLELGGQRVSTMPASSSPCPSVTASPSRTPPATPSSSARSKPVPKSSPTPSARTSKPPRSPSKPPSPPTRPPSPAAAIRSSSSEPRATWSSSARTPPSTSSKTRPTWPRPVPPRSPPAATTSRPASNSTTLPAACSKKMESPSTTPSRD
jgi:hypothetical protein